MTKQVDIGERGGSVPFVADILKAFEAERLMDACSQVWKLLPAKQKAIDAASEQGYKVFE